MEYLELLHTVGINIKSYRKELGLTQKEMAVHGIAQRHMQDIESGNGNLTLKTLWKLSQIFKVRVTDLITRSKPVQACDFKDGIFDRLLPFIPIACIVWEYDDSVIGGAYRLKDCNKRAEEITFEGLSKHKGRTIGELFPATEALGFIAFLYSARKSNKAMRMNEYLYTDVRVPFSSFSVSAVPICKNELVVFFERQNEKMLFLRAQGVGGALETEMEEIIP